MSSTPAKGLPITQGLYFEGKPPAVIKAFFSNYSIEDVQHYLNELLICALTTDNENFGKGRERSNAIMFCEQLLYLSQAVHDLKKHSKKRKKK